MLPEYQLNRVLHYIYLLGEECYSNTHARILVVHGGIAADQSLLRYCYRRLEGSCCLYIQNQAVQGDAARP